MIKSIILCIISISSINSVWSDSITYHPNHCTHLKNDAQIHKCLTNYAMSQLETNSAAEKVFNDKMERHAHLFNLDLESIKKTSLKNYFRIYVDQKSTLKGDTKNQKCFLFSDNPGEKREQILNIERQIFELTSFLAEFHALSLGRQASILFPIKEVSVCGIDKNGDRAMAFRTRRLHFGVDMNSEKVYLSDTLMDIWNSGNPIRVRDDNPLIHDKITLVYNGMNGDLDAILRDKIAEKWNILNPVGEKRLTAISIITSIMTKKGRMKDTIKSLKHSSQNDLVKEAFEKMISTVEGVGFGQKHRDFLFNLREEDPKQIIDLYKRWISKMNNISTIASYLEAGMVKQSSGSEIITMARRQTSLLAGYANSHDISVNIGQLLSSSINLDQFDEEEVVVDGPQEELSFIEEDGLFTKGRTLTIKFNAGSKVHTNFDSTTGLLFAGNTSDVVDVGLQLPKITYPLYKRATLFEILEEGRSYSALE